MSDVGISTGSTWEAKDKSRRVITVRSEVPGWRNERQFTVASDRGREFTISYSGLMRKYRRQPDQVGGIEP
jgi:hypothetical protein